MKILYFTQVNLGLRRGHVYNIINTSRFLGGDVIISAPIPSKKIQIPTDDVEIIARKKSILSGLKELYRLRNKHDVFYYRNQNLFIFAIFSKFLLRKRIIVEVHGVGGNKIEKLLWHLNLQTADGIVFITHALKKYFNKYSYKSIVVLCNTYDKTYFDHLKDRNRNDIRKDLNLPLEKKLVVYVGNTITYDFESIIKAVKKIDDICFVIVGVTDRSKLLGLISKYDVNEEVVLVERLNHKEALSYIYSADILVVPYVGDGPGQFPIKIFEYLGSGRPIISFVNDSIKEVLKNEVNALLIDLPNAENWETAIKRLISDKELSGSLSKQGIKDSTKYTWEKRGASIREFLDEIINPRNIVYHRPYVFFTSARVILNDNVLTDYINNQRYSYVVGLSYKKLKLEGEIRVKHKKTINTYLDKSLDDVFSGFNDTARNEIRRTFNMDELEFKLDDNNFDELYEMYRNFNLERELPVHDSYILKTPLKFKAYYRGELISAITCYDSYPYLRIQFIFSRVQNDKELRKITGFATRRLIYEICKYGVESSYKHLDFASINMEDPTKKGIAQFKSSFGGIVEDEYTYTYKSRVLRMVYKLVN